jgi:hypothetical protein
MAMVWVLATNTSTAAPLPAYPGPVPGPPVVAVSDKGRMPHADAPAQNPPLAATGRSISIGNSALLASWALVGNGLGPLVMQDVSTPRKRTLPPSGEAFAIVLAQGQVYPASAFCLEGEPGTALLVDDPKAPRMASRIPGRQLEARMRSSDGRLGVVWRAILHDGANYIRQEIDVAARNEDCQIQEIVWFDAAVPDIRLAGSVDGSPIVTGDFFFGCEDPMALNAATAAGGAVSCRLRRNATLRRGETLTVSFVAGVAPAGQMRRAFLYYLERERAHAYRPFLHYNSWYDIAWDPFAMNENNCLDAIRTVGERFIKPHGVVVDSMVFDDGWDDPKTLWQFHKGFPHGFTPHAALCREYNTRLGVWLSPFGGYGVPKDQRIQFGSGQGFETNATGFSLAGTNYYAAFKRSCVEMIRRYGANHFKFDGIATGMYASGGGQYVLDTEAMRRLMLELRREEPSLYINLTTGSWPSPFWLRYADSLWRQGNDMDFTGKGPKQQQWITYRDQETHRNVVRKGPLYPLNSLMTQGVAYSRHGTAGEPSFNSAGFKDDVRAFFGSGTGLQELYLQPDKLTAQDWIVLAEAAKWSRASADVLVDTHWIGGDPGRLEPYGWAAWSPRKGIVTVRNPDDQPRQFALNLREAFELPAGAPARYSLKSPWAEHGTQPAMLLEADKPARLTLKPFEVVSYDAIPVP